MKKLLAALALTAAAGAVPAFAGNVGVSISLGEPGFYGQLDINSGYRPRVLNNQPVVVERRYRNLAPIYLRVPSGYSQHWSRYCGQYNACTRPVYFVRDDWYRNEYAPRYRQQHQGNWHDDRNDHRNDGHDNKHDDHRDDHRDNRDHDRHDNDDHHDYRN